MYHEDLKVDYVVSKEEVDIIMDALKEKGIYDKRKLGVLDVQTVNLVTRTGRERACISCIEDDMAIFSPPRYVRYIEKFLLEQANLDIREKETARENADEWVAKIEEKSEKEFIKGLNRII